MSIDYKKAVKQAKKELEKEVVEEVKGYVKKTLEAMDRKRAEMTKLSKELKVLKVDLADLEAGRLKNIKRRQQKDKIARQISQVDFDEFKKRCPQFNSLCTTESGELANWNVVDTVTYTTTTGNNACYYMNSNK